MIDDKRMAEIRKHLRDAEFGYGVMDNRVYFKDVKQLLEERDVLTEERDTSRFVASKIAEVDTAKDRLLEEAVEQAKLGKAAIGRLESENEQLLAKIDRMKLPEDIRAENERLLAELEQHRQLAREVIAEEQP